MNFYNCYKLFAIRILHKEREPLEVGSLYWELHDSVVNCELIMLRSNNL